jgi:uncharacterized membrane protein (DUF106 family)
MKRIHFGVLIAAIALGSSSLAAQQPTPAATKGTAQHDSLKSVKKSIRSDKAARKAAKAKGDTASARKLKKQLKAEKKTKAGLQAESTTTKPKKKP